MKRQHSYLFMYRTASLPRPRQFSGRWLIRDDNLAQAKAKLKMNVGKKYPGVKFEIGLLSVDGKRRNTSAPKPRGHKVRAIGAPGSIKEGDTEWERVMKNSPDLLRFAKFALVSPLDTDMFIYPQGKTSYTSELASDTFLKFSLSRLTWNSLTDTVTGYNEKGDAAFKFQLQTMPLWVKKIVIIWRTAEFYKEGRRNVLHKVVKQLSYDIQSSTSTAPPPRKRPLAVISEKGLAHMEKRTEGTTVKPAPAKSGAARIEHKATKPTTLVPRKSPAEPPEDWPPSIEWIPDERVENYNEQINGRVGKPGLAELIQDYGDDVGFSFEIPDDLAEWRDEYGFNPRWPLRVNWLVIRNNLDETLQVNRDMEAEEEREEAEAIERRTGPYGGAPSKTVSKDE